MKPELRLRGFTNVWKDTPINELLTFNNGINAPKESYGHGRKFINVLDILNNNYVLYENIIGSVKVDIKQEETSKVEYGDMLFLRSSETREDVGKSTTYLDENEFALFGGFVIRGKKIGNYNPYFLKLLLDTSSARDQISSKAGGSTRYNVSQSILNTVELFMPDIQEQEETALFFMLLDRKIEKQQEKIKKLEELKKGMMQKMFAQEIRFKDESGEEFPEWRKTTLDKEVKFLNNKRQPIKENLRINGPYPYYGATGIIDYVDGYIFEGEYLLLAEDGANIITRSAPIIYKTKNRFWVNNHAHILKPTSKNDINFFEQLLEHINYIPYNSGTAQPKLNVENVKNIKLFIPVLNEQKSIGAFFKLIDEKVNQENEKSSKLEEQKKGFMQRMFV